MRSQALLLLLPMFASCVCGSHPAWATPDEPALERLPIAFREHYDGGERVGHLLGQSVDLGVLIFHRDDSLSPEQAVGFRHLASRILREQASVIPEPWSVELPTDISLLGGLLLLAAYSTEPVLTATGGREWHHLEEPMSPEEYRGRAKSRMDEEPRLAGGYLHHIDYFIRQNVLIRVTVDARYGGSWQESCRRHGLNQADFEFFFDAVAMSPPNVGRLVACAMAASGTAEEARTVLTHFLERNRLENFSAESAINEMMASASARDKNEVILVVTASRRSALSSTPDSERSGAAEAYLWNHYCSRHPSLRAAVPSSPLEAGGAPDDRAGAP